MEEKGPIKISLSTFLFLLFIVIVVIGIMGYVIYKLQSDKQLAGDRTIELSDQVSILENTVKDLQEIVNDTSDTITVSNYVTETKSNSSDEEITETEDVSTTKTFSEKEIKDAIQNYLDIVGALEGSPIGLLTKLNMGRYTAGRENEGDNYLKTDIKYSEYKAKMLNYMTEEWFENNYTELLKNEDGYVSIFDGGATGMVFEVKDITLKGDYSDSSYIADIDIVNLDDSREQDNIEFHIENYNGKCVISYCDF